MGIPATHQAKALGQKQLKVFGFSFLELDRCIVFFYNRTTITYNCHRINWPKYSFLCENQYLYSKLLGRGGVFQTDGADRNTFISLSNLLSRVFEKIGKVKLTAGRAQFTRLMILSKIMYLTLLYLPVAYIYKNLVYPIFIILKGLKIQAIVLDSYSY